MLLIKHILILGVFGSYLSEYVERFLAISGAARIAYLTLLLFSLISVYLLAFLRNNSSRAVFAVILAIATLIGDSYTKVTAEVYSYSSFTNLVTAAAFADDALSAYGPILLVPIVKALILLIGMMLPVQESRLRNWISDIRVFAFFGFVIFSVTILVYTRGGHGGAGIQRGVVNISYATLLAVEFLSEERGPRRPVAIQAVNRNPEIEDIILIIDESVRGDYLDINSPDGVRSGFKNGGSLVFNFGLAASATTCSYMSNMLLRFGGTRQNFRRQIGTGPSIWSYAKAAGFRTNYLDAQRTDGGLHNGMDQEELEDIDEFIQFDGTEVIDREPKTARAILSILANQSPDFVIVNKMGAHFPVNDKYPDLYLKYEPALDRGVVPILSYIGNDSGLIKEWNWVEYSNSYKNTLEWAVGAFFDSIFSAEALGKAVIIYTADHGQTFHEDNSPGLRTHCSGSDSKPQEGTVPMVIISGVPHLTERLAEYSEKNFNQTSHYNLFSTMLDLLGFKAEDYSEEYGESVLEKITDEPTFNTYPNVSRLGSEPVWMRIEDSSISNTRQK